MTKNNTTQRHLYAKYIALHLSILLGLGVIYTVYTKIRERVSVQMAVKRVVKTIEKQEIKKDEEVSARIATTTPRGKKVTISFRRCESFDEALCFGHEAVYREEREGVLLYDRTSTDTHLYFGSISRSGDKWPYSIDVDFGNEIYDEKDYIYFKNKIPSLFFKNIRMSQ